MMETTVGEHKQRGFAERLQHSKYTLPAFALALGIAFLVIQGRAGDWRGGMVSLGIMAGFGGVILFGGRSETIRGLRGDGRDERMASMDLRATAFAGVIVIIAIIVGFGIELWRGHDGSPYTSLGAIAGIAYLVGIVVLQFRS